MEIKQLIAEQWVGQKDIKEEIKVLQDSNFHIFLKLLTEFGFPIHCYLCDDTKPNVFWGITHLLGRL